MVPRFRRAGRRALQAGQTLHGDPGDGAKFRAGDPDTPLILMGYYNPIYIYGVETFLTDAKAAGVDGLIIVDCPPEEDDEICLPARAPAWPSFVWSRRPPANSVCRRSSRTAPALSILFQSRGSPAPPRRM